MNPEKILAYERKSRGIRLSKSVVFLSRANALKSKELRKDDYFRRVTI